MKTNITDFQRNFRKAREAADQGDSVIIRGENGEYVFERRAARTANPFAGLEHVFGAVSLTNEKISLRDKVRARLAARARPENGAKNHRRRRGSP